MPRTLPWQVKPESRRSSVAPSPGQCDSTPAEKGSRKRRSRSRSSAPITGPPTEEYMIEGFENDDQYVMVEDEFLSTAQTFTRHLHQAEYSRRKKPARIQNANTIGDLARPTGPKARMSTETKKNMESKAASAKHKAALDRIKDDPARPPVDSELEDEESEEDDPWMGTQLQSLMTSPRKSRSLVGLQGVKSNTRAAHGFSNAAASQVEVKEADAAPRQIPGSADRDEEISSGDDDDLGRPWGYQKSKESSPSPRSAGQEKHRAAEPTRHIPKPSKPPPPASADRQHTGTNKIYKSRMSKLFDEFDDEPTPTVKEEKKSPKKGSSQRFPSANKKQEPKSNKDRLNQVPTFL